VEAVTWVTDIMNKLEDLFSNEDECAFIADYEQTFRSLSFLTLVVEHIFLNMHGCYATLYMLQYAWLLMPTIQEMVKRMTNASFIYFASKKAHYPDPTASVCYAMHTSNGLSNHQQPLSHPAGMAVAVLCRM